MTAPVAAVTASVRPYRPEDRASCLAAFDSNVPKYFDAAERADFETFLDDIAGPYFVVVDAHARVRGCGGYALDASAAVADLCWAMVHRDSHGERLGQLLLDARLDAIRAAGIAREVRLSTSQHTAGFYLRVGFITRQIVPGDFGPGLDRCDLVLAIR